MLMYLSEIVDILNKLGEEDALNLHYIVEVKFEDHDLKFIISYVAVTEETCDLLSKLRGMQKEE